MQTSHGQRNGFKRKDTHKINPEHASEVLLSNQTPLKDDSLSLVERQVEVDDDVDGEDANEENLQDCRAPSEGTCSLLEGYQVRLHEDGPDSPEDRKAPPQTVPRLPREEHASDLGFLDEFAVRCSQFPSQDAIRAGTEDLAGRRRVEAGVHDRDKNKK